MSGASQQRGGVGRAIGFAGRNRAAVIAAGIALVFVALLVFVLSHTATQPAPKPPPVVTIIAVQPPKPPPPPPPLPQPKMISPPKEAMPEAKPVIPNQPPKAAPPKPAGPAAPALGTSIHNSGAADSFDLSGNAGGNGLIGGGFRRGEPGSAGHAIAAAAARHRRADADAPHRAVIAMTQQFYPTLQGSRADVL
jgi:hypothetical protein